MKPLALALLTTSALVADSTPDPDALLERAKVAWGVDIPNVAVRWDDIGPCVPLTKKQAKRATEADMAAPEHIVADVRPEKVRSSVTFTPADGAETTEATVSETPAIWVILLNTSCTWDYMSADRVIEHEIGHVLGVKHSKDPKDVMFGTALRGQKITERDRRAAARK
jgi:hypothetical protein